MSDTVYLLGAGASVHAGYPLANDFLKEMEILSTDREESICDLYSRVAKITSLLPGRSIEEIIDISFNTNSPEYLRLWPDSQGASHPDQPGKYFRALLRISIVAFFRRIEEQRPYDPVTGNFVANTKDPILTFNWDSLIDPSLKIFDCSWLDSWNCRGTSKMFLKLHGSADHLVCKNCKEPFHVDIDLFVSKWMEKTYSCPFCGGFQGSELFESEPLIIGFIEAKSKELAKIPVLQKMWNVSRYVLINSDKLVVIGLSFSGFDLHIRLFLQTVLNMRIKKWQIEIIDSNPTKELKKNVLEAFGARPDIDLSNDLISYETYGKRIEVQFTAMTFAEYVDSLDS